MQKLNLPSYQFNIKTENGQKRIFDGIRKRYVQLTPEEWVRQHFIRYLAEHKKYPLSLIAVEKELRINKLKRRPDIVVFNRNHQPLLVVECKAPSVRITQETFDQVARYNIALRVKYLVVTNGMEHFCCKIISDQEYIFLKNIPDFSEILP